MRSCKNGKDSYHSIYIMQNKCFFVFVFRNELMLKNEKRVTVVHDAINYFDTMTMFLEEMRLLQRELRHLIR